jgi:hypothetical protein
LTVQLLINKIPFIEWIFKWFSIQVDLSHIKYQVEDSVFADGWFSSNKISLSEMDIQGVSNTRRPVT